MRTQFNTVEQHENGKFYVIFETFVGEPGKEYVLFETTSAPLFATEDEAYEAANRCLDFVEMTGRFPNMCEKF